MTGPAPGSSAGSGRPGRIVIGTLGLDQHEVGAMAISRILIRHGYEVIYLGRFNTPERLTTAAEQEDADLVGVSIHSWEYAAYADELLARCRELGIGLVLGGSVLTERDQADLLGRGADAVFGPYASEATMLEQIDAVVRRVRAGDPPAQAAPAQTGQPSGTQPGRPVPLAGRTVIVTGAARGLGRAYTLELCRQGAAVVADDIDEAALKEVADAARDLPGSVHTVVCDVTGPDAPRTLVDAALRRYGRLHGLVSNAGLLRSGPILQLDDSDLRLLLDVHVTAPFRLLRAAGRYWRAEAKAGRARRRRAGPVRGDGQRRRSRRPDASDRMAGRGSGQPWRQPRRRPAGRRACGARDRLAAGTGGPHGHRARPGSRKRPDLGAQHLAAWPAVPAAIPDVPRGGGRPAAAGARQRGTPA